MVEYVAAYLSCVYGSCRVLVLLNKYVKKKNARCNNQSFFSSVWISAYGMASVADTNILRVMMNEFAFPCQFKGTVASILLAGYADCLDNQAAVPFRIYLRHDRM